MFVWIVEVETHRCYTVTHFVVWSPSLLHSEGLLDIGAGCWLEGFSTHITNHDDLLKWSFVSHSLVHSLTLQLQFHVQMNFDGLQFHVNLKGWTRYLLALRGQSIKCQVDYNAAGSVPDIFSTINIIIVPWCKRAKHWQGCCLGHWHQNHPQWKSLLKVHLYWCLVAFGDSGIISAAWTVIAE